MSALPHNTSDAGHIDILADVPLPMSLDLDAAVRHFAATADGLGAPRPGSDDLTKMVRQVATMTLELFPGRMAIDTDVDPEIRDDVCLLVQVDASGSVEEIVATERQWHHRLVSIAPQWPGLFCLSVDVRE